MPDWLTHILAAWILWKLLEFKFKCNTKYASIVMIGALIPDAEKIGIPLYILLGIDVGDFVKPLQSPIGAVLLAALISLFFREHKWIFTILIFGAFTHLSLDMLMTHVTGGEILLFFPFSLAKYQLNLLQVDNYYPAAISIALALAILIFEWKNKLYKGKVLIH